MNVVIALINDDEGQFLCLQRRKGESDGLLWVFPGGKIEQGESEEAAVAREVLQETGLVVHPERRLGEFSPAPDINLIHWHCVSTGGELTGDNDETAKIGYRNAGLIQQLIAPRVLNPVIASHVKSQLSLFASARSPHPPTRRQSPPQLR